jgi:hypothetical protein
MTYTLGNALRIPEPRRERFILEGRLHHARSQRTWWGLGWDYRINERFRVITPQWFPVGAVLVCEGAVDIDCFLVDVDQTMAENGFTQEWLDANQPGGSSGQIDLFGF